jgi:N-glycosylase/DNA lyase
LRVSVEAASLSVPERREIKRVVQEMFRLKEDLGEFYGMLRQHERYRWITRARAGRLLRSPTVFEDIVKMICTTNCTWALTTVMVTNLCRHLGSRTATGESSFPTAGQMADVSEKFFRTKIRAGYRSPYLLAFARAVAEGSFDPEALRASAAPTEDIYRQLLDLPGVGPYAAQNMLKLLGRYDYLGLDSWVRGTYAELYHRGRQVSDRTIERQYRRFGKWRGLVFWLEMTRRWFNEKFPL